MASTEKKQDETTAPEAIGTFLPQFQIRFFSVTSFLVGAAVLVAVLTALFDGKANEGGQTTFWLSMLLLAFGLLAVIFGFIFFFRDRGIFLKIKENSVRAKYGLFKTLACELSEIVKTEPLVGLSGGLTLFLASGERVRLRGLQNASEIADLIAEANHFEKIKSGKSPAELRAEIRSAQKIGKIEAIILAALIVVLLFLLIMLIISSKTVWMIALIPAAIAVIILLRLMPVSQNKSDTAARELEGLLLNSPKSGDTLEVYVSDRMKYRMEVRPAGKGFTYSALIFDPRRLDLIPCFTSPVFPTLDRVHKELEKF